MSVALASSTGPRYSYICENRSTKPTVRSSVRSNHGTSVKRVTAGWRMQLNIGTDEVEGVA